MGMTMVSQMMTGDGGDVAVIDGFWLVQGMMNQMHEVREVRLNPSVHWRYQMTIQVVIWNGTAVVVAGLNYRVGKE